MEELMIFKNEEFGQIRTLEINNEPWFVGKDVAEVLGYKDASSAILDHVDEEDRVNSKTQGCFAVELGQRGGWLINESGLYSLILSSKLESAKRFKRWVTTEVLPSIRKHGGYVANQENLSPEEFLAKALQVANNVLATKSKELEEKNKLLEQQAPKVEAYDTMMSSHSALYIGEVAKLLNNKAWGQKRLFQYLRNAGVLMGDNLPYQKYINNGYFRVVARTYKAGDETRTAMTTLVLPKGIDYIKKLISCTEQ